MERDHPRTVMLLVSTCCHEALVRPFLHVARLLVGEGVRVVALLTDGNCCSFFSKLKPPAEERCEGHRRSTLATLQDAGLTVIPLWTMPFGEVSDEIVPLGADTSVAQYTSHALWKTIRASVTRDCDWDRAPADGAHLSEKDAATVRRFLRSAARYQRIFHGLFTEYRPSHVLLFNGVFYEERIAYETAASLGIGVVTHESCCFHDRWIYRRIDERVGVRESFRLELPAEDCRLSAEETEELRSYLADVYGGRNNRIYQPAPGATSETLQRLAGCGKRIALFLGQVPYDTVITEDETVSSVEDVVLQAIDELLRHDDWHLVVRLHPGARQTASHHDGLAEVLERHPFADRFTVVKAYEVSTYDLMEIAAMGMTISSQAGLELLGQHKPVVVLGDSFYRGNGATVDRAPGESVGSAIERGLRFDVDDRFRERADAVLYHWIFRHLTPIVREDGSFPLRSAERILQLFDCSR